MTPDTVAFAVRSVVRLGSAARQAYEQSVRDATMRIPDLPVPIISNNEALFGFFDVGDRRQRIESGGDLHDLWVEDSSGNMVPRDDAARDILVAEQLKILQQLPGDFRRSWISQRFQQEAMSGVLVKQWKDGTGPPTPALRLILAFTDVALDYVGSNPGILGVGGNGEKLITALSANFRRLLPDVDKKDGWKGKEATTYFVERALSITLHAGLKTISETPTCWSKKSTIATCCEMSSIRSFTASTTTPTTDRDGSTFATRCWDRLRKRHSRRCSNIRITFSAKDCHPRRRSAPSRQRYLERPRKATLARCSRRKALCGFIVQCWSFPERATARRTDGPNRRN